MSVDCTSSVTWIASIIYLDSFFMPSSNNLSATSGGIRCNGTKDTGTYLGQK